MDSFAAAARRARRIKARRDGTGDGQGRAQGAQAGRRDEPRSTLARLQYCSIDHCYRSLSLSLSLYSSLESSY